MTNFERARTWILMAISDLERVARNLKSEDFAAAVFRAQMAVERLCKAIIFLLGLQFKKTHKPTVIIREFLDEEAVDELQKKIFSEIVSKAKILEDQGTLPRYGVETVSTILRPEEIYDKEKTASLIRVTKAIAEAFIRLLETQKLLPDMQSELRRVLGELSRLLED